MKTPRDYQVSAITSIIDAFKEYDNVLFWAGTGSGKTVVSSAVIKELNVPTLFLVNRQTLVGQTYETLTSFGLVPAVIHNTIKKTVHGIEMNSNVKNSNVVISLVKTLENTDAVLKPELIVIDEAHKSTSESYQALRKMLREIYPEAKILGLTATPGRKKNKDGEKLEDWYDIMISSIDIKTLIEKKYLSKPTYISVGETANVVETWKTLVEGDVNPRTIFFVDSVEACLRYNQAFRDAGIKSDYIVSGIEDDDLKDEGKAATVNQRNEIFRKFYTADIEVLISVYALAEGFDETRAKYCMIARNIGHISLYHQIVGRVLRIDDSIQKYECTIIDFASNIENYGPIEDYVWEIDGGGYNSCALVKNGESIHYGNMLKKEKIRVVCHECHHVYDINEHENCPSCAATNTVKITASFKQLRDHFINNVDPVIWAKFKKSSFIDRGDEFFVFFDIVERAIQKKMTDKYNEMYFELFTETGEFIKKYRWMKALLLNRNKVKTTDKVEFVL